MCLMEGHTFFELHPIGFSAREQFGWGHVQGQYVLFLGDCHCQCHFLEGHKGGNGGIYPPPPFDGTSVWAHIMPR